jgi:glyoxylase-like metal-dependent hydrolase (beta-lactamase superfamily II)
MIKQISENVWKFYYHNSGSNCYLISAENKKILIDTSSLANRGSLESDLRELGLDVSDIDMVLLTHLHYDHTGNLGLFKKAKIYASAQEIKDFKKSPSWTVLGNHDKLRKINFLEAEKLKLKDFRLVMVPGHTSGSIAFYMPKEKILFSGDTLFDEGIGRTDLPTSNAEKMEKSLMKLEKLGHKILCAGH